MIKTKICKPKSRNNKFIDIDKSLLDILSIEIVAQNARLALDEVKALKDEYK